MTNFPIDAEIYPLLLEPVARERIWGGRMLADLMHKALPDGARIGETWEAWPGCTILQGKHAGKTLGALLESDGQAIIGEPATGGMFPLLFKYLDAHDHLSVQVHPDDALAQALESEPFGKTEAWYVLHAEPGAELIHGFRKQVSAAEVAAALQRGSSDRTGLAGEASGAAGSGRLAELLEFVKVQPGDVFFLPAGTVHALGKGMLIAEIQQNSDLTYRLYDWDRLDPAGKPRDLHIEKALRAAQYAVLPAHQVPSLSVPQPYGELRYLVACRYFAWEQLLARQATPPLPLHAAFHLLAVLDGGAAIRFGPEQAWTVEARAGQTVLVPAALEQYSLAPLDGACRLLRMYIPELRRDVIEPLQRAGIDSARIALLGGPDAAHNDLRPLLQPG